MTEDRQQDRPSPGSPTRLALDAERHRAELEAVYDAITDGILVVDMTGALVFAISSVAGVTGVPTRCGYSASKHALVGFFDTLRIELAPKGITVTVVYPDFVTSEIRERAFGPDGKPLGKGRSPVREKEVMSAEECARLAVRAIAGRERELFMTTRSRVGRWLKLLASAVVDRVAARAIAHGK